MNNIFLEKENIFHVDRELRDYYFYIEKLKNINDEIKRIDVKLNGIGSPAIRNPEEAKYQRGTVIFSNLNMLELFEEQDKLQEQKRDCLYIIKRTEKKLQRLDKEELKLVELRYNQKKTLRQLADIMHSNKDTVKFKIDEILILLVK